MMNVHVEEKKGRMDFLAGPVVKNPPANEGDTVLTPGPGRFHRLWGNYAHVPPLLKLRLPRAHAP